MKRTLRVASTSAGLLGAAGLLVGPALLTPPTARACGGFFCGQQPVDQSAERVIFAVHPDGSTEMIVQISFMGDARDFAWVLPLGVVPDRESLATFPQRALVGLDAQTGPRFQWPDDCWGPWASAEDGSGGPPRSGSGSDPTVHIRAEVGPYDVAVIEDRDPAVLVQWLRREGFRVATAMEPYIARYTAEGMKFLALKLLRDRDVRDIAPFRMRLPGQAPGIPLRLTALAAEPEMGVVVFILGDMRYGPANWPELSIDDADIVWRPGTWPVETNWTALVARAVDEAGGQGWVTELAGPTMPYLDLLRASPPPPDEETRVATEALIELLERHPYITRLYTRLSPEEMTSDPVFRRTGGPDVDNVRRLPRYVDGEDVCDWSGGPPAAESSDPCDFATCGRGGLCRSAPSPTGGAPVAGCACVPGATARTTVDPMGRAAVSCVDMRMSFLNPGDSAIPGETPLPDPCVGYDCGAGRCVAQNMTPTCVCDAGMVAVGWFEESGARRTRCVAPSSPVPPSFYDRRLPPLPADLPGGRTVDVPPPRRPSGGGLCAATTSDASGRGLLAAAALLAGVAVARTVRRKRS
ncbi:MAG: DUF2330 domain-containing protein [Myxococcota bacterium]|nr:DUF2330 domain-containing protein [Myxococcota bacterium]MDW8363719.1 DUF2330 domain-containing protein [Myxococcales bacterium]